MMTDQASAALRTRAFQNRNSAEHDDLFSPYRLGDLALDNRIVMSCAMTRSRALAGNVPMNPLAATYYAQRASAGLIITEATQVSPQGVGYVRTPGIHSFAQVAGWKKVTEAVHRAVSARSLLSSGTWDASRIPILHGEIRPWRRRRLLLTARFSRPME